MRVALEEYFPRYFHRICPDVLFIAAYMCNPPVCISSLRMLSIRSSLLQFTRKKGRDRYAERANKREREKVKKKEKQERREKETQRQRRDASVREKGRRRLEKKWKFIETVIRTGGFAHSSTTRMLFSLRKIEFTGKFYTDRTRARAIAFPPAFSTAS